MKSDSDLLHRFLEEKSESAFTELVRRYMGLVYSVSLRRVGRDVHLAEDVSQKVFSDFARKASTLRHRATLAGWFHHSALLTSASAVRAEQRRKTREAGFLQMQTSLPPDEDNTDWSRLRPLIDDLIAGLRESERDAVMLRFFEQRRLAEVGSVLRISEDAARKRIDRILEKLHRALARRGITSTSAVLGVALAAMSTSSSPAGLTTQIAGRAFAHAAGSSGLPMLTTIGHTLWPVAAALIMAGLTSMVQQRASEPLRAELSSLTFDLTTAARLRQENLQLARLVQQSEQSRLPAQTPVIVSEDPMAAATARPGPIKRPVSAVVNVSPAGRIFWDGEGIRLDDFIERLRGPEISTHPDSRLEVQIASDASSGAFLWLVDEIRKTGSIRLSVQSEALPDPAVGDSWF